MPAYHCYRHQVVTSLNCFDYVDPTIKTIQYRSANSANITPVTGNIPGAEKKDRNTKQGKCDSVKHGCPGLIEVSSGF